jgi:hypothetical protein
MSPNRTRLHRSSGIAGSVVAGLGASALAWLATAKLAHAQQFTLVDETFSYTKAEADATQSHHFVKMVKQPSANWTAPVDYRKGSVHIRTEVLEKAPGGEITQWSICYFGNNGSSYGCSESGPYTAAGVVERDVGMLTWWQNETIDWTKGVKEMAFVMKDKDEGGGHTHKRSDPEHFFPTKVRITMVQVAAGATYDPSKAGLPGPGGAGPVDAGSAPEAGAVDAASGAGGASGTGGASGSGGATGAADAAAGTGGAGAGGSSTGSGSGGAAAGGASAGGNGTGGASGSKSGGSSGGSTPAGGQTGGGQTDPASDSGGAPSCAIASDSAETARAPGVLAALAVGLGLAIVRRRRR